jgi:5-formyltetrahydrofolate cyclo-ligase
MDGTKQAIRQEMRRRRRLLSPVDLSAADRAVGVHVRELAELATAPVVLAYAATDHEVPTAALLAAAFAAGQRVFLPRLVNGTTIFAEHRAGAALQPGPFGILEPLGDQLNAQALVTAIAFVPLLAWDTSGARLGRGGGHYDRAFAGAARPVCLVGLGYAFQQHPRLPQDAWDLRLDAVISQHGVVRCWSGDAMSLSRKEDAQRDGLPMDGTDQHRAGRGPRMAGGLPPTPAG